MIASSELLDWLKKQGECGVWIDDGGLTIESETGDYLEIGGKSEEEES